MSLSEAILLRAGERAIIHQSYTSPLPPVVACYLETARRTFTPCALGRANIAPRGGVQLRTLVLLGGGPDPLAANLKC